MTTEHLEVERKYDVDAGRTVPDLGGVLSAIVGTPHEQ